MTPGVITVSIPPDAAIPAIAAWAAVKLAPVVAGVIKARAARARTAAKEGEAK